MTDRVASDSSPRSLLATRFLHALGDFTRPERERRHAASLLRLFATDRDAAQLEAILLDPAEPDPWVRTYVLRAIVQQGLPLNDLAYRRCRDLGLQDDAVVRALEQSASQQRMLDREPMQHENAAALLDAVADDLAAGRRVRAWSAIHAALEALHEPARHLDALIAARPAVLPVVAWFRARCEPAPRFEDFPLDIVLGLLSRVTEDPLPRDRALLVWLANQPAPRLHHTGLRGLLVLDRGLVAPALVDRLATSSEPLVHLLTLEARLTTGDDSARAALIQAVVEAPHVVLRAQALRSLRGPQVSAEVFRTALRGDRSAFDLFYLPAVSEAALGLARGAALSELDALTELVDAHLTVMNDDAPHAIEASMRSWLAGTPATIRPVWYALYMARGA